MLLLFRNSTFINRLCVAAPYFAERAVSMRLLAMQISRGCERVPSNEAGVSGFVFALRDLPVLKAKEIDWWADGLAWDVRKTYSQEELCEIQIKLIEALSQQESKGGSFHQVVSDVNFQVRLVDESRAVDEYEPPLFC